MKFEPLEDRVLILRQKEEQKGLIVIPDVYQQKAQIGKVIAVSGGKRSEDGTLIESMLNVGDKILFGKYTGTEIKLDDIEYIIMREGDVLGVLHDDTEVA